MTAGSTREPAGQLREHAGATKGDRTRRRLLDATAAEVARRGVAGASIAAIAEAAGLKTGSIYFHYASRDELIEAMLEEGLRATIDRYDRALASLPPDTDAAGRLIAAIHAHAGAVRALRDYTIAVLSSFADVSAKSAAHRLRRSYVARWAELIAEAQRAGALPDTADPRMLRDLLLGALNAVSLKRESSQEVASALIALLRLGLTPG